MSLFRLLKYSSLVYLLGRHRDKLYRSLAVLLFALLTSLLYDDLRAYLELQHPGTLLYALVAKVLIVYGALAFVLWQFRPRRSGAEKAAALAPEHDPGDDGPAATRRAPQPADRLQALADIDSHERLRSRYERILAGESSLAPREDAGTRSRRS